MQVDYTADPVHMRKRSGWNTTEDAVLNLARCEASHTVEDCCEIWLRSFQGMLS